MRSKGAVPNRTAKLLHDQGGFEETPWSQGSSSVILVFGGTWQRLHTKRVSGGRPHTAVSNITYDTSSKTGQHERSKKYTGRASISEMYTELIISFEAVADLGVHFVSVLGVSVCSVSSLDTFESSAARYRPAVKPSAIRWRSPPIRMRTVTLEG